MNAPSTPQLPRSAWHALVRSSPRCRTSQPGCPRRDRAHTCRSRAQCGPRAVVLVVIRDVRGAPGHGRRVDESAFARRRPRHSPRRCCAAMSDPGTSSTRPCAAVACAPAISQRLASAAARAMPGGRSHALRLGRSEHLLPDRERAHRSLPWLASTDRRASPISNHSGFASSTNDHARPSIGTALDNAPRWRARRAARSRSSAARFVSPASSASAAACSPNESRGPADRAPARPAPDGRSRSARMEQLVEDRFSGERVPELERSRFGAVRSHELRLDPGPNVASDGLDRRPHCHTKHVGVEVLTEHCPDADHTRSIIIQRAHPPTHEFGEAFRYRRSHPPRPASRQGRSDRAVGDARREEFLDESGKPSAKSSTRDMTLASDVTAETHRRHRRQLVVGETTQLDARRDLLAVRSLSTRPT